MATTVDNIFKLLKQYDPYDKTCKSALPIDTVNGVDFILHVDMSPYNEKYGHMWEWWLESSRDGYMNGGFEPANDDAQLMNLASVIHATLEGCC